jgi:hypothetical protein
MALGASFEACGEVMEWSLILSAIALQSIPNDRQLAVTVMPVALFHSP